MLTTDRGNEIETDTVIIATGASAKYLGLEDEKKYNGQGCECLCHLRWLFLPQKTVAVVGGGDTACEEAHISQVCAKGLYDCAQIFPACF